ncbi:hypothetical protein [Vibrio phage vB_VibM_10AMN]|uniref:Uncharacterized protein n=1 Tax=Staphylococcus phage vB_VibM_10AMN12 TaxID=3076785 RepID=A0AA96KSJ8_9CAUD|nr:hypothetical protein [Vibrio phage vB_VibM_10AMN]WNO47401.1 hypothetical protein [Staphylococcus phage vB_VibM_10AMN12]
MKHANRMKYTVTDETIESLRKARKESKALEKRRVQQEIEEGEELYYALIEDELDDECGGWENR